MKRVKVLVPVLTAVLLLFPGINVQAARMNLASGTKKATATFTLKNLQSLEGEVLVKSAPKDGKVTLGTMTADTDPKVTCKVSGHKVFMVGAGDPVTTIIKVELEFSKDGTYVIELDGGKTDADGKYVDYSSNSKKYLDQIQIVIGGGTATEDEKDEDDKKDKEEEKKEEKKEDKEEEDKEEKEESTGKKKDSVDYSALEKALEDADKKLNEDKEMKDLQTLLNSMNDGTVLLTSNDQDKIDEAALEIQQSLQQLEKKEAAEKKGTSMSGKIKLALVLTGVTAVAAFGGAAYYFWKKEKAKPLDYDGAPMVEYDIEEDDE